MKRVIDLLIVLVLLTFAFPVLAQDQDYQVSQNSQEFQGSQTDENDLSAIALRKTHRDNWFVSLGLSGNILFAEQDQLKSPLSRIKLGGEFEVGKWLNPNFGIGLSIAGGGLRGFNEWNTPYESWCYFTAPGAHIYDHGPEGEAMPKGISIYQYDANGNVIRDANGNIEWDPTIKRATGNNGEMGFYQDFTFVTPTFDLMANITNLFRGYAVDNSWFDLIGFAGVGPNFAFSSRTNPNFWSLAGRIGLRGNFNLTKNWTIFLQSASNLTEPEFDGYKGTAMFDMYLNTSIGVQYTFNKNVSSFESMTIDELDRLNGRINENRNLIDNHQDILERQQRLLDKLRNCCDQKPVTVIQEEPSKALPGYVRFGLDSYVIERYEQTKISDAVDFLKNNPNSNILLIGYADKKTGNPTYNYNLSKKRVDAVKSEIIRLGISEDRVSTEWKGDKEQPFGINEWNRVVMMVEKR